MATKKKVVKKTSALDAITQETELHYAQNDGRVIARARDVLLYELSAIEDHLAGLRTSTAEVQAKKTRIEARIAGLSNVLARR